MRLTFSLRAVATALLGLTTGCNGGASTGVGNSPNGAPLSAYAYEKSYDGTNSGGVYDVSQCSTLSPSANTDWARVDETFGVAPNATTVYNKIPFWPKNSTINLYVNGNSTFVQAANDAIQMWNATLQNRATGDLQIALNVTNSALNNQGAVALGFPLNSSKGTPDTGGFTALDIDQYGTTYQNASITIFDIGTDGMDGYTYWYNDILHEAGHALGLAHNSDQQSVMYYADRSRFSGVTCYSEGRVPPPADTALLESHYDPIFVDKSNNCSKFCYLARMRSTRAIRSVNRDGSWTVSGTYVDPAEEGGRRANATWAAGHRASGRWLRNFEGNEFYGVSSESLVLSSTLVARVTAGSPLQRVVHGNETFVLTPVRIAGVLKSALGPDRDRRAGESILVAEPIPPDGTEYTDEPRLHPGDSPLMFLQRDPRWVVPGSAGNHVYLLTYPMVSKWYISLDRKLHVAGLLNTRVAREVDSMSGPALGIQAIRRYGVGSILNESSLVSAILRRRSGRAGPAELDRYRAALTTDPKREAANNSAYDTGHRDPIDY